MNALILAAGRGTRLTLPGDGPKCLAQVGQHSILERSLDALDALDLPVTIVVGHAASQIESLVAGRRNVPTLLMNERYREGSVVSLAVGLASLKGDALLLDGDVVYAPELLRRLVNVKASDALLVDFSSQFTDEQFMAGVRGDRIVELRRGPVTDAGSQGEWIGLTKLSANAASRFLAVVNAQIARGDTAGGYEDALGGLLGEIDFTCVPTDGLPWVEVDFPDDLTRARALFGAR